MEFMDVISMEQKSTGPKIVTSVVFRDGDLQTLKKFARDHRISTSNLISNLAKWISQSEQDKIPIPDVLKTSRKNFIKSVTKDPETLLLVELQLENLLEIVKSIRNDVNDEEGTWFDNERLKYNFEQGKSDEPKDVLFNVPISNQYTDDVIEAAKSKHQEMKFK